MNAIKKLLTSVLIVFMFFSLPQEEAEASETVDGFNLAAMNLGVPSIDSNQTDCNGFYTILSPCYRAQMNTTDNNGDGTINIYDTFSYDQSLKYDEDRTLPWHSEYSRAEPQAAGVLIPVLHF